MERGVCNRGQAQGKKIKAFESVVRSISGWWRVHPSPSGSPGFTFNQFLHDVGRLSKWSVLEQVVDGLILLQKSPDYNDFHSSLL